MLDPHPKPSPTALVLVIDDEPGTLQVRGALLEKHGHQVMTAAGGEEALATLKTTHPDIILLDVLMPEISGFDLCRKLRDDPATRDIPILFLSAVTDKNFVVAALDAGAVDYITKPFHGPELISRVELHVSRRKTLNQLAKAIREKNRLLEIVAHDLKNPLSGIQFAATILAENPTLPDNSRAELIRSIDESAKRAFEIVSGLLETQTVEEAKTSVSKAPQSLRDHAHRAVANFEHHCRRKDIHIEVRAEEEDISVVAESRLLICCLENLVSNAIKFSPPGSKVTIHVHREGSGGVFRIEDEGPGINDDELPQLFGKFTRLSARPTSGEASTGLGLHIVHELVTAMEGRVDYRKRDAGGAIFLIELPLAE